MNKFSADIAHYKANGDFGRDLWLNPVVWAGWLKGTIFKHGIGKIQGDGHQMPGIFFLKGGKVARRFIYKTIADEPDYLKLVGAG